MLRHAAGRLQRHPARRPNGSRTCLRPERRRHTSSDRAPGRPERPSASSTCAAGPGPRSSPSSGARSRSPARGPSFKIKEHDTLVLVASHRDIDGPSPTSTTGVSENPAPSGAGRPELNPQPWPALLLLGPTGSGKTPLGDEIERRGLYGRRCLHFDFGASLRAAASAPAGESGYRRRRSGRSGPRSRPGRSFEERDLPMIVKILSRFAGRGAPHQGRFSSSTGFPATANRPRGWAGSWPWKGSSCSTRRLRSSGSASGSIREATGLAGRTTPSKRSRNGCPTTASAPCPSLIFIKPAAFRWLSFK